MQCDSTISRDNPLYHFYSTNFHEAAAENRNVFYSQEADQDEHEDDLESVSKIDTDENRDSVSTFDTDPDKESVELLNGEVEEPISEEELFMYHKVQEADECDEWLDCYGAGILCGVSNKQAEEILESLVKKDISKRSKVVTVCRKTKGRITHDTKRQAHGSCMAGKTAGS